ncbi:hypothetical protein C9374_009035 [Naegleria lovaniensis]|uniref:Uncharacterized protein n=1 Tax=Naegleria lovaniensis TaxID=51637 RepID=A0AA88KK61_NAELO|nr:uncharacterized protein C9374_009035 [Naegleria lovaniensis]KAG2377519.1 hypothetical protein C9374_009035 [Naegleria lovaniensis]
MKRLFITTFFPYCSNNNNVAKAPHSTALSPTTEEEPINLELISRTLSSRGLTDNDLLKAVHNGRNTLQQLASSLGISVSHLQEYHKHLVNRLKCVDDNGNRRAPSKPTPIRVTQANHHHHNAHSENNKHSHHSVNNDHYQNHHHSSYHHHHSSHALQSSTHSLSSSLSSFVKENYFSEDVHTETSAEVSSSIHISTVSNTNTSALSESHHSPFSSSLKSGGISSSIDYNFFDDDSYTSRSARASNEYQRLPSTNRYHNDDELDHAFEGVVQNAINDASSNAATLPPLDFSSPEEKAKEELQNIIGIIQNQNKAFPKSALVAAFKKLNDEGRLPSTPFNVTSPLRPLTPTSPAVQVIGKPSSTTATVTITDIDSDCTPTLVSSVILDDSILLRPSSSTSNCSNSTTSPFM